MLNVFVGTCVERYAAPLQLLRSRIWRLRPSSYVGSTKDNAGHKAATDDSWIHHMLAKVVRVGFLILHIPSNFLFQQSINPGSSVWYAVFSPLKFVSSQFV